MKNGDIYLDFTTNPSLADAMGDANVGDKIKLELEIQVKSKDDKGISASIEPGSVVPDGYEKEEAGDDSIETMPPPQPPGAVTPPPPVIQAMNLRKKGS